MLSLKTSAKMSLVYFLLKVGTLCNVLEIGCVSYLIVNWVRSNLNPEILGSNSGCSSVKRTQKDAHATYC